MSRQRLSERISPGGDRRTITVTFDYGGELHTLVARTRKAAFQEASERWGWSWDGEPVVSSPYSIYCDLTGRTKMQHGQDFQTNPADARKRERYRRTALGYNEPGR